MVDWWRCIQQATRRSKRKSNVDHLDVENREEQQQQAHKKEGMMAKMMEKLPRHLHHHHNNQQQNCYRSCRLLIPNRRRSTPNCYGPN
jgi:hypothetical protein